MKFLYLLGYALYLHFTPLHTPPLFFECLPTFAYFNLEVHAMCSFNIRVYSSYMDMGGKSGDGESGDIWSMGMERCYGD